jgi:hypothetical protein
MQAVEVVHHAVQVQEPLVLEAVRVVQIHLLELLELLIQAAVVVVLGQILAVL